MAYSNAQEVLARVQEVTEFLGIELSDRNQFGIFHNTLLSVVTTWGDIEAVRLLLDAGADVNARLEMGETTLHDAVARGQLEIAKLLLERGALRNIRSNFGDTPLDLARKKNDRAMIDLLGV